MDHRRLAHVLVSRGGGSFWRPQSGLRTAARLVLVLIVRAQGGGRGRRLSDKWQTRAGGRLSIRRILTRGILADLILIFLDHRLFWRVRDLGVRFLQGDLADLSERCRGLEWRAVTDRGRCRQLVHQTGREQLLTVIILCGCQWDLLVAPNIRDRDSSFWI